MDCRTRAHQSVRCSQYKTENAEQRRVNIAPTRADDGFEHFQFASILDGVSSQRIIPFLSFPYFYSSIFLCFQRTKVRLGDIPTWSNVFIPHDKSNVVSVDVEQIFQHDREDIAIIKLQQPVALSELIVPICLPTHDNYYFRELNAHVCLRKTHRSDTSVISVPVSPLLPQDCNILLKRKKASYTQELFCAWDEMGDTCTGDLGSPLTTTTNGRVTVIGLNSFTSAKVQ